MGRGKVGRPFVENPKDRQFNIRLSEDELRSLNETCKKTKMSKADTIRTALERFNKDLEVR